MSKHLISLALVSFLFLSIVNCETVSRILSGNKNDDSRLENNNNNNNDENSLASEEKIEALLVNTIRRGMLAEVLLNQRLSRKSKNLEVDAASDEQQNNFDVVDNDDLLSNSYDDLKRKFIEKRYPKWRTGGTRTRVKNIAAANNNGVSFSHWEKNLAEKDKMYQNLLG
jgi:hypothetical protein